MIQNYLKVALRYLTKHKGYTFINILGLAVGITCCTLIMLFVKSEWSYDRFHSRADRIYRVWQDEEYQGEHFVNVITPIPMAGALQSTFPEVEATCRVFATNALVKVDDNSFNEEVRIVDSTFFRIFDFNLVEGSRHNPFPSPSSVILTKDIAQKYFGNSNPIGRTLQFQMGQEQYAFQVAGVAAPAPEASSIKFDILLPASLYPTIFSEGARRSWFNIFNETYVLLRDGVKSADLQKKFPAMMKQQLGSDYRENAFLVHLQPITKIHLDTSLDAGIEPTSNPKYAYILATIGVMILLIACVNFITLAIGRSATRALEVGVRKVLGAGRRQLIRQFWGEAFLLTLCSVAVALALSALLIQPFNELTGRNLSLDFDLTLLLFGLAMVLLIALVAGIYPAIVLSGFRPIEVLKGKLRVGNDSGFLRKSLIVGQFIASIGMIACTLIIEKQMAYFQSKDLGYNKEQMIIVPTNKPRREGLPLAQLYRAQLLKLPQVESVTTSVFSFAQTPWATLGYTDDKKVYRSFQANFIDPHFIQTMNIPLVQGRNFQEANTADVTGSIIINETFAREFGLTDPIGKKVGPYHHQVIGVVKDFNFESLHTKVQPLMLAMNMDTVVRISENAAFPSSTQPRVSVRFKTGNASANIAALKDAWKAVAPNQEFEYSFLDETIAAQYRQEQRTSTIVKLASALSVFIACMGLFGLATLTVTRRTKEIGIRKVLGASVPSIVRLISKDFVSLIAIASLIAFPLAWYMMNNWLSDFAYRISIQWWVFVLAAVLSLFVALVTVSIQAVKAALANPVKSLRTE